MYLDYATYLNMGGTLEQSAFNLLERKAETLIKSQAMGQTGKRIGKLTELPQAVKDCTFDLIQHLSENAFDGKSAQSESQSLGGQSESYTYLKLTKEQADSSADDIIFNAFFGGGIGNLLYWGGKSAQ